MSDKSFTEEIRTAFRDSALMLIYIDKMKTYGRLTLLSDLKKLTQIMSSKGVSFEEALKEIYGGMNFLTEIYHEFKELYD